MATRTLGIKFQVKGFEKASKSLSQLEVGIKKSKKANEELRESQVKTNKEISKTKTSSSFSTSIQAQTNNSNQKIVYAGTNTEAVNRAQAELIGQSVAAAINENNDELFDRWANALQDFKKGNVLGGLFQLVKKPIESIVAGYYEAIGGEFGSRVGQRLLGAKDPVSGGFKGRGTDVKTRDSLSSNLFRGGFTVNVNLTSENIKDLSNGLKRVVNSSNGLTLNVVNKNEKEKKGNIFSQIAGSITDKLEAISSGYYEGIGNLFGTQFATGLSQTLEEEIDYSQERKGRVVGKTVGFVVNDGLGNLDDRFNTLKFTIADLNSTTERLDARKITKFVTALVGIPNSLVDSTMTGFRRASVKEEATRKVDARKAQFNEEIENIQELEQIVITASGFAGQEGQQGRKQAERLREINQDDKTAVISSDTSFTDVMFQATDLASGAAWGVNAVANAAKINLKGFNPDAVEMVNKVLALKEQNPEIQIKLVGHSAGGFVVEEAQYLLEQLEVDNVEAVTAGTPNLKGNLKPENIRRIFAEEDPLNALHQAGALVDFVNDDTEFDSVPGGHFFEEYIRSPRLRELIFNYERRNGGQQGGSSAPPNNDQPDGGQGGGTPPNNDQPDGGTPSDLEINQTPLEQIRANFETYINLINNTVQQLQQQIANILNPANLVADIRAARLTTEGQADLNRRLDSEDYDNIEVREGTENIIAVIGGYAGVKGKSGQNFANKIGGIIQDDTTQYIGLTNEFTDVVQPGEQIEDSVGKVAAMFAEVHRLGYNPDSTKAAAEIIKLQEQNPDLNIKIAGYSGGGYVAEDVIRLLQDYGANMDNIEVMGVGTPDLPGGIDTEGFNRILGERDPVLNIDELKRLNQQIKDLLGFYVIPELTTELQNIEGIDTHSLDQYLFFSEEFQRFLYGDTEKVQQLKNIYEELNRAQNNAGYNAGLIERVEEDEELLDPEEKAELIGRLRENQIEALKRVSDLSAQAKEAGGGKYFTRHGRRADRELEKLGLPYGTRRVTEEPQEQTEPELTLDQYVAEYRQYLDNLIQEAEDTAEEFVLAFIPNYNELDDEDRKAYFKAIRKDVEELATFYRESLEAGDTNLAREIGEELLKEIQAVKRIYRDLRAAGITDRSLAANLGRATSIENEIRRGQPNLRGRDPIGLEGRFANNLEQFLANQLNEAEEAGEQVAQGFIQGILEDLREIREAGQAIADETIEATEENLDIQSPSGVFRRIGHYLMEGFNLGIEEGELDALNELQNRLANINVDVALDNQQLGLLERRNQLEDELNALIESLTTDPEEALAESIREEIQERTTELREVLRQLVAAIGESNDNLSSDLENDEQPPPQQSGNFITDTINSINSQIQTLANSNPVISSITRTLSPLVGLFLGGLGIKATLGLIKSLGEEFVETAIAAETLEKAIIYSSRNIEEGLENLKYVTTAALELDIDVSLAQRNYSSLIGAAKNTILEGFQTEDLFEAFATTASNRGLSTESQDRLFTAISQIVGKRKLTAEEVRGQIGDISGFGDFIGLVGEAQGVSTPQLEEMMSRGQLRLDILPKVAALLNAKNLMNSMEVSTASLQVRVNNASNSFKVAVGKIFLPLKRLELRIKSLALGKLAKHINNLAKIIFNVLLVVILAVVKNVNLATVAMKAFMFVINGIQAAVLKLWGARGILMQVASAWLLIALAIKSATNAYEVARNKYSETYKDIKKLELGINALAEAWNAANEAQIEYANTKLPQTSSELRIADGFELPDNWLGNNILKPIAGGDNLNLDNFVRRRLQGLEIFGKTAIRDLAGNLGFEGIEARYNRRLNNTNFKTLAQKRENDLIVSIGDFGAVANQTLMDVPKAMEAAEKINDYDSQIAEIQSQRLLLLPGDEKALKESLAAEREIQKKRNEELKILSQEKENIQLVIATTKKKIQEVEEAKLIGGITESRAAQQLTYLNKILEDSEGSLEAINEELARLPKQLSEFSRRLQISEERDQGFLENRDLATQEGRINIIREGIESGTGEQIVQLQLSQLENEDLNERIEHLTGSIEAIQRDLRSPQLAAGIKRIEEAAAAKGVELTTATLTNFLEKEDRDPQEQEALRALLNIRQNEAQILQFREQLAQNIQQSRNDLRAMNRTVNDYFFNLQQKIKEAQIETERLVNQIFSQDIKGQLRRAIAPGSESFINGIIEGVQSLFDQVQQIFEQRLGLRSSRLQFESEAYSNEQGMRDFIKQVRGATDALLDFRNGLTHNADTRRIASSSSNNATIQNGNVLTALRRAIFSQESGADFTQVNPDSGALGYGQVMPSNVPSWTTAALGHALTPDEFLANPEAQIKTIDYKLNEYLQRELKATGNNLDLAIRRVASAWYSGQAKLYDDNRPQTYNGRAYPSIRTYTYEVLEKFKNESGSATTPNNSRQSHDFAQRAISGNQEFNAEELRKLELQEILSNLGVRDLETAIAHEREKIRRQFQIETIQKDNRLADLLDKLANLQSQSVRSNADIEIQRDLRAAAAEFRNLEFEGLQQTQALSDELATIEGILQVFPDAISQIQASGDAQAQAILPVLNQILNEAENALPKVKEQLEETVGIYKAISAEEANRIAFIEEQGKLKKRIAELTKKEELQQLKSNIATQRGTNEQIRQNKLAAERVRLEKRIAQIKQQYDDGEQRRKLIELEKRNSAIAEEEINREADNRDLSYEQELLNLNSSIEGKRAELIRGDGFELEANRIQREDAIAQEDLRYRQQIAQLENQYAGEPEKLEELKRKAEELNQISLLSIEQQFKDLGATIRDTALGEFQNFFSEMTRDIDNVGQLFLNMIENIARSIAQLFAKQAASKIFSLVFRSAVGGFRDGGTVENFEEGGTVERIVPTPISDRLREISAPIRNAFRREGSGGRLAVFTPGEEILSIKTGEAGRYQSLKREFGVNPLEKIFAGNFVDGGSIEANLLAGLDYSIPKINVSAIGSPNRTEPAITKNFYMSSSYHVPDVDSFRASEYQIQQGQIESLRRLGNK
ncbi:MAG: tape measure protein [Cyanobacteria bacterium P01_F01_bin.143]